MKPHMKEWIVNNALANLYLLGIRKRWISNGPLFFYYYLTWHLLPWAKVQLIVFLECSRINLIIIYIFFVNSSFDSSDVPVPKENLKNLDGNQKMNQSELLTVLFYTFLLNNNLLIFEIIKKYINIFWIGPYWTTCRIGFSIKSIGSWIWGENGRNQDADE